MEVNFDQLVVKLDLSSSSNDILPQITRLLEEVTDHSFLSFVPQAYQSLLILEHKIWQVFSEASHQWLNHTWYTNFFQTFGSFNKKLVFTQESIPDDRKISLLIPESTDQVDSIFKQIEQTTNESFMTFVNLWFDNLSFLMHEYPLSSQLPVITHINQYFVEHVISSETFMSYLSQFRQTELTFTAKQLFYMKTSLLSLNAYLYTEPQIFNSISDQIIQSIGREYLQIIQIQSYTVESWSKEMRACITHLIGFLRTFLWWNDKTGEKLKNFFLTEKNLYEYIQAIIRIIECKSLYPYIMARWCNDETILMDSILLFLINIVQTQNINWFFHSMTQLPDLLMKIAETSVFYRIYLCAYGLLSEILTDENLKELKVTDTIRVFFFNMLEQAWRHPSKKYKQIPIIHFLRGFLNLSKNDFIQEKTAQTNKISLFIEMADQYPIVFDIIWALSFNQDIQEQLRSNPLFISKISHLAKECDDEQMRKTIDGILWNLQLNHQDHPIAEITDEKSFDIMISYSHKDKVLCKQLYDELIKAGYRVWIDFDQMHGNVMDAMAQAIERSHTIIICMSEQYRRSNYCRAEAHYAFQRERKIVPVLMQKHYKADGWLLFLTGHLLYVDFTKYEFERAMGMLWRELKATDTAESDIRPVLPKKDTNTTSSIPILPSAQVFSENILEWTQEQVHDWLIKHQLVQMSRLLINCNGRTLAYLYNYIKYGQPHQILSLLQEDSLRRTNESISLVELSCFHSLMDQLQDLSQ